MASNDSPQSTAAETPGELEEKRRLGFTSAVFLVVANMIGAGVFTTSGFALADLGEPSRVLAAWVVGGVFAACGALCYGALARRLPHSGGEYLFLARTVHPVAGFLAGWVSLLAGFTAPIAAAALGLQAYLGGSFGIGGDPRWVGTATIVVATLLHGMRLRSGVIAQNVAVGLKLALIAGFIILGAVRIVAAPESASSGLGGGGVVESTPFELAPFAVSLVWISFSYSGWNAAVYIAGEVRDPERNLARSLLVATGIVTVMYLTLNAVFVYSAPVADLAGQAEVGAIAAEALGGTALRKGIALVVALALFTSVSSMVMAGPRVYARMAKDGAFPAWFAASGDVPTRAVLLQGGLALIVLWISDLRQLLGTIGFTLGLSAAVTICGLMFLRRREGAERVPVPGYPFVPLLFVVGTLCTSGYLVSRQPRDAAIGLGIVLTGLVAYGIGRAMKMSRR